MNAKSLPARIGYAVLALLLGAAAGFYSIMLLMPELVAKYPKLDTGMSGQDMFNLAVSVGAGVSLTAALFGLTLPWIRHRKRRGRPWRIAVSFAVVLIASVAFADMIPGLVPDLLFAAWLAYTMAYTFVRYGVVDDAQRRSSRYY
jgi:uncharacterized membrane protein YfcA